MNCTCPFVPFPDDPYFMCAACEQRAEERERREEIEDEENARNEAHARDPEQADFDCNCGMNSAADCMCFLSPPLR